MYDVIVIGGGPAGLAAALSAKENGAKRVLIIERGDELGGILNQCIHNGFGLHTFAEELTGPEYAQRFIDRLEDTNIEVRLETTVLAIDPERNNQGEIGTGAYDHQVHMVSKKYGYNIEKTAAVVLAMGCRERPRGGVVIPGTRPAGVFTAGTAQKYVNVDGYMPGKRVVILGSGDIGLIMARRMTLEGAEVLAVVEIMPYSGGLNRNIVQCLEDYDIPLYLSHSVTEIRGKDRVEQVVVSEVDKYRNPIPDTEMVFDCDTLLLSCGLIPENELSIQLGLELDPKSKGAYVYENMEASIPGVFVCGNVAHVHDLVDFVTEESTRAGAAAAEYAKYFNLSDTDPAGACETANKPDSQVLEVKPGWGVGYTLPQKVRVARIDKLVNISFRVKNVFKEAELVVSAGDTELKRVHKKYLVPGEMQKLALTRDVLEQAVIAGSGELRISIEEITVRGEED